MSKDIQDIATSLVASFNTNQRANGELYYFVEVQEANEDFMDFIRDEIHEDFAPDDFKYYTVYHFIEAIAEGNVDYLQALDCMYIDIGMHDLQKWASSHLSRSYYVNTVLEESDIRDFYQLLAASQWREIEEICELTFAFLEKQVELNCDQQEEEEYE